MHTSRNRALAEISGVILTGLAFLIFENILHLKLPFLVPCVLLWLAYLIYRIVHIRSLLVVWGLNRTDLKSASLMCSVVFSIGLAAMLLYRLFMGWFPLPPNALWVLLVYPVWAFIQQFVVQALLVTNLQNLGMKRWKIILVAAALFGFAHLPDLPLALLCFTAGLVWTPLFIRARNLYPLALTHAWLGTLLYYWVLERDPWLEMFPGA